MASPTFLGDGSTPRHSDTKWTILQKILGIEVDGGGSGGGTSQVFMDRAPAAPDDPSKAALSYNSSTGVLSQWDKISAWV
jgi:hypothetical protein